MYKVLFSGWWYWEVVESPGTGAWWGSPKVLLCTLSQRTVGLQSLSLLFPPGHKVTSSLCRGHSLTPIQPLTGHLKAMSYLTTDWNSKPWEEEAFSLYKSSSLGIWLPHQKVDSYKIHLDFFSRGFPWKNPSFSTWLGAMFSCLIPAGCLYVCLTPLSLCNACLTGFTDWDATRETPCV